MRKISNLNYSTALDSYNEYKDTKDSLSPSSAIIEIYSIIILFLNSMFDIVYPKYFEGNGGTNIITMYETITNIIHDFYLDVSDLSFVYNAYKKAISIKNPLIAEDIHISEDVMYNVKKAVDEFRVKHEIAPELSKEDLDIWAEYCLKYDIHTYKELHDEIESLCNLYSCSRERVTLLVNSLLI